MTRNVSFYKQLHFQVVEHHLKKQEKQHVARKVTFIRPKL